MKKILLVLCSVVCALFTGIGAFCLSSDEDFRKTIKRGMDEKEVLKVVLKLQHSKEDSDDSPGGAASVVPTPEDENGGGTTVVTTGAGLNLMLINNITTEGYVKDFLSMYLENCNGQYSGNSRHAPLEVVLNAAATEHGYYPGGLLPRYIFPWDDVNNAPYYNTDYKDIPASEMTLRQATTETYRKLGTGKFMGGIFGITVPGDTVPSMNADYRATVRPATEAFPDKADPVYFPDALCYGDSLTDKFSGALLGSRIKFEDLDSSAQTFGMSMANNRGPAATACMMSGLWHGTGPNGNTRGTPTSHVNMQKLETENKDIYFDSLISDIRGVLSKRDYISEINDLKSTPACVACYYGVAALESGNWFCSKEFLDSSFLIPAAAKFGEDRESLQRFYRGDLSALIEERTGVSISSVDISNVYNIPEGSSYDFIEGQSYTEGGTGDWYGRSGYIFTVHNVRSAIYKNQYEGGGMPFLLQSFELSGFMYAINAAVYAPYIYAAMLKYTGVGVDPTNPETYMESISGGTTWVPTSDEDAVLVSNGLDVANLTEKGKKIVQAAARLTGLTYHQCNGQQCIKCGAKCDGNCYNSTVKPTHLDCSAFVWRACYDAGFQYSASRITTANIPGSNAFREIDISEARPGDFILAPGHVMLYIGHEGTTYHVLEASGHSKLSGYGERTISASGSKYKFYTLNQ